MDNARQQIVDSLKAKSNILVTVSTNPSVDELSAALGLSIILNNQDKRASAIFGGAIPPAITFLQPEKTFESSPDSLRDFIIALDKEKADHLRYKVEGEQVKIFITPYKTTLSENDLEFSQGDYNVELVIALGVKNQDNLDKALEAHGKILHDATVMTITNGTDGSTLGSVDWHDGGASSLSEMIVGIADGLKTDKPIFDEQIATALLTGIVSATDRFSNERTSSRTMTVAAQLMAAGANQQLIAAKLEDAHDIAPGPAVGSDKNPPDEGEPKKESSELTIDRPGRTSSAKTETTEKAVEPLSGQNADDQPKQSRETLDQLELEKQLLGITTPATTTETMADIEKELQQAANEAVQSTAAPESGAPQSLTAASDTAMPGFEAPEPPVTEVAVEPEVPVAPEELAPEQSEVPVVAAVPAPEILIPEPVADLSSHPQIIQDHGPLAMPPLNAEAPPINGTVGSPNEGEQTIDPFMSPLNTLEVPPMPAMNEGTPEGATLLASEPTMTTVPTQPVVPAAPAIPQLPPLPPLPTDGSLPPLPPPPPPPPAFQSNGPMPAGPVTGDVFGDGEVAPGASGQQTPPPEPGQFRIPGQS